MTSHPVPSPRAVRAAERAYRAALRAEESAPDLATAWRRAAASDRALRRLQAAREGRTIEAPRTARNLARGGLAALATIGRAIGRALTRAASLRKAQIAASLKRAARAAARVTRLSVRRAVLAVAVAALALVVAPSDAAAHPGHDGHDEGPLSSGLVGPGALAAGLAGLAWSMWGERRERALASAESGRPMAGGSPPEPPSDEPPSDGPEIDPDSWLMVWTLTPESALNFFGLDATDHEVVVLKEGPQSERERERYRPDAKLFGIRAMPGAHCAPDVRPSAVTDEQIKALREEALAAGDHAQAAICDHALDGDANARAECARVIAHATAQR